VLTPLFGFRPLARRVAATVAIMAVISCPSVGIASELTDRFQAHINYLASDELEGRGVGSRGIELAAEYIAKQFTSIGLEPAGENGGYFQAFDMTLHRELAEASRLAFESDSAERKLGKDFIPFNFSSEEAFSGGIAFCGYGIVAPDKDRDDFVHIDPSGKVVLMLRGEPPSWADESGNPTPHAQFRNKVYNAKDRNAVAVLIVNQTPAEGLEDELTPFEAEGADAYGIPAFHINRAMADAMLSKGGLGSLAELQERLDQGGYASKDLADVKGTGQAVFRTRSASTRNVLGVLRGQGPNADEYVVIGAHYDHLGIRKPMMRTFKAGKIVPDTSGPQIHNGADDNASGTSGIIEIARLFASGPKPKRSILFIAFTGEESGLHGSKHYVDHPAVPLDKTAAMLNLDMVGRMPAGKNTVEIFGVDCAKEFKEIVDQAAASEGLQVAPSSDTGGRSDHASFIRHDIPSMHFFSGQHADYHKPSDDSDKINAADGARIVTFVQRIAMGLAGAEAKPTFQAPKAAAMPSPGDTPTYRVVMGLAPGYGDDGKPGMAVEAVTPEGPAAIAGMKMGDRIVRIGGKKVANVYDYMAATRGNKAGDTVDVVVLREGAEVALKVTLSPAR